jgi:hypothetical protein
MAARIASRRGVAIVRVILHKDKRMQSVRGDVVVLVINGVESASGLRASLLEILCDIIQELENETRARCKLSAPRA